MQLKTTNFPSVTTPVFECARFVGFNERFVPVLFPLFVLFATKRFWYANTGDIPERIEERPKLVYEPTSLIKSRIFISFSQASSRRNDSSQIICKFQRIREDVYLYIRDVKNPVFTSLWDKIWFGRTWLLNKKVYCLNGNTLKLLFFS